MKRNEKLVPGTIFGNEKKLKKRFLAPMILAAIMVPGTFLACDNGSGGKPEHTYQWIDTTDRQWVTTKPATTTATGEEKEQKKQVEKCLEDGTIKGERWLDTGVKREIPKVVEQTGMSNKVPGVADIDIIAEIRKSNGTGGVANGGIDETVVGVSIVPNTLGALSNQAAQLQTFFNDSKGNAFFTEMASVENTIRTKVQSTTPQAFVAAVDTARAAMVLLLTQGMNSADKTIYDTLLTGYQAGHYVVTRDWATAGVAGDLGKITEFREAVKAVIGNYPTGNYNNGRGVSVENVGTNPKTTLGQIETALVNAGIDCTVRPGHRGIFGIR